MTIELELRDEKLSDGSVVYNLDLVDRYKDADHVRLSFALSAQNLDQAVAAQHVIKDAIQEHTCERVEMVDYLRHV